MSENGEKRKSGKYNLITLNIVIIIGFIFVFYQNSFDYFYWNSHVVDLDHLYITGFGKKKINLKYTDAQLLKIQELKKYQYQKEYVSCRVGGGKNSRTINQCVEKDSGIDQEYLDCKDKYLSKRSCKLNGGYRYFLLSQIDLNEMQIASLKNFISKIQKILFLYLILISMINYCFFKYYSKDRFVDYIICILYNLALYIFIKILLQLWI